ncbi:hypothetical protein [Natrinema altunense]|uniref:Uncharacterized protein n=1 Tax=Natrinema altunense (strain JCM 12890 / CGMCC 1.3731 / AJ2) TaxID=1227494 RepID=L9ZG64_NATA2|nr:hypothetical protein [Natrinema altunense]ELY85016.1 hypothetical protein C485_13645 [Natrinema altunense JCM 12890]
MKPRYLDAIIDLAYGGLIFVSVVLIVVEGTRVGLALGLGVLVSYALHVIWKMARFDPEWMTREVEETVEDAVEQTIGEQVDTVQQRIETVDERIDRRPREDEIEDLLEETVADEAAGGEDGTDDAAR